MQTFVKLENFLYQTKELLLENSKIRKLLYYPTPNALSKPDVTKQQAEEFITLTPIIWDENGIAESFRNVFISIYASLIDFDDIDNNLILKILVFTNKEGYELENNKIRVLTLLSEISKQLENHKFEFSGKIYLINAMSENLSEGNFAGYVSTWAVTDSNEIL